MVKTSGVMTIILLACVFSCPVQGADPQPGSPPAATAAPLPNPAGESFAKANEALVKKDLKKASEEIRKGAAVLKQEEAKASAAAKKELAASEEELEKLAKAVEKQTVKADKEVRSVFARAHAALARNHVERAKTAHANNATLETAQQVKAAATQVDLSVAASKQDLPEASKQTLSAAHAASEKQLQGTGESHEETAKHIEALSKLISTLQDDLNKMKAQEAATQ